MIVSFLLNILFAAAAPLLKLASFAGPPVSTISLPAVAVTLAHGAYEANRYLPVDQFVLLVTAGLAFDLTLTGAQFFIFLYRLIPGKAT